MNESTTLAGTFFAPPVSGIIKPDWPTQTDAEMLAEWRRFYAEVFGFVEPLDPILPHEESNFGWIIIICKGLTLNKVIEFMQKKMKVWISCNANLDQCVTNNDRIAIKDYAVRIRNCIEADKEMKDRSATWLLKNGIKGVTLLERLVLELFCFWKVAPRRDAKRAHLDVLNRTLCSGSRFQDGCVPYVDWDTEYREVRVAWCDPDESATDVRAREVVVL